MAGHARRAAALTELEVRASRAGLTPLEWIEERLSNGATMVKVAEEFTTSTGIEITRNILTRICNGLEEDAPRRISTAHEEGAHALIETQYERLELMDSGTTKEEIALENLRTKNAQWIASKKNRKDFGDSPAVAVHLSLGALHLDVLRRLSAEDARLLQRPKEIDADYEILPNPESLI